MNNDYFNTLLKAIEIKIKEAIPEFEDVGIFGGGFNGVEDIKKFTSIAPALRIGLAGLNPTLNINTNQLEATMDLSVLFITKDIDIPDSRHEIALQFLQSVLLLVKDGLWGVENTFRTDRSSVTAQNYYGPELLGTDIAMWQVNWQQKCILGTDRFDAEEVGKFPKSWKANTDIDGDGVNDETAEYEV